MKNKPNAVLREKKLPLDRLDLSAKQGPDAGSEAGPVVVRPRGRDRYQILTGARRYEEALGLGKASLRCHVDPYLLTDAKIVRLVALVGSGVTSEIERGESLLELRHLTNQTWKEVAAQVKLSDTYVKNLAGLPQLEEAVRQQVRTGAIPGRTAIALQSLSPTLQIEMAERVVSESLTMERLREELRTRKDPSGGTPKNRSVSKPATDAGKRYAPGDRLGCLQNATDQTAEFTTYLDDQDWNGGPVTERERAALKALGERLGDLHQRTLDVYQAIGFMVDPNDAGLSGTSVSAMRCLRCRELRDQYEQVPLYECLVDEYLSADPRCPKCRRRGPGRNGPVARTVKSVWKRWRPSGAGSASR